MARVFGDLEKQYFAEVLDSRQLGWVEGGMVTRFERAFAEKVGARYAIARNSAMSALAEAVSVSGAGTGLEVICDPMVQFGAIAALYFNAVPRFADVRYDTYLMDPASLRANITDRTRAVIVTHFWGMCAELDEIRRICDEHNLFLIEDCAHAIGATWQGKHAGTYGDFGCFSFQQGKHMTTGDGGMMTTNREDLYHKLFHEWAFGESPSFMTLNFRMNEVTGAVGLAQLQRVDGYIAEYTENLRILNAAIEGCPWLRPRHVPEGANHVGYIWACTWEGDKVGLDLEQFKQLARDQGLNLRFGFIGKPAYLFDLFRVSTAYNLPDCPVRCPFYKSDYRYREGLCPVAEELMPRLISSGLIEAPPDEIKRRAERLHHAIHVVERG
ncbi:MAG TPA: DegT/DnrJ/EryC1/StrS family aminotransferase [Caldilineaceae bacterium]|nr:DegT/DnrJ/EryC1/StrS family aminotransferase [Caldilineaceae bacterium]